MNTYDLNISTSMAVAHLATVAGFSDQGKCRVELAEGGAAECGILQTSERFPLCLVEGDAVLVCVFPGGQGVVLGRVGPSTGTADAAAPDHLVLEATKSLTLQCGEGSITLRGDGKVLVKGTNLVSKAEQTNRILGASVAVN